jgi:U4/U6.U5 tri-snRNP-associated protein 1
LEIASDYLDPSAIKIKKPKKKKQKNPTRVTGFLGDEGLRETNTSGIVPPTDDIVPAPLTSTKREHNEYSGLGDDEELQEMLAQRRRQALKRKKISCPEDIVRNIRQFGDDEDLGASENGGLVIDDTSEFVRGLEMSQLERTSSAGLLNNENPLEEMDIEAAGNVNDIDMPDQLPEDIVMESNEIVPSSALDDEPIVASSLAATLAALKRTGMHFAFPSQSNYFL